MIINNKENFKKIIANVFQSIDDLKKLFDDILSNKVKVRLGDDEIESLKALLKVKICHLQAFEILTRYKPELANEVLFDNYLGYDIDLSNNSYDHVQDLDIFFECVADTHGKKYLKELLQNQQCSVKNKNHPVVLEAIATALDLDDTDQIPDELIHKKGAETILLSDVEKQLNSFLSKEISLNDLIEWSLAKQRDIFDQALIAVDLQDEVRRYILMLNQLVFVTESDSIYSRKDIVGWHKQIVDILDGNETNHG